MENGMEYIIDRLEAIDKKFDEKLDRILVQTTKTNGRVNNHDEKLHTLEVDVKILTENKNLKNGRDKTIWAVIVAASIVAGYFINNIISTHIK